MSIGASIGHGFFRLHYSSSWSSVNLSTEVALAFVIRLLRLLVRIAAASCWSLRGSLVNWSFEEAMDFYHFFYPCTRNQDVRIAARHHFPLLCGAVKFEVANI